jgi:hypothetical protein
MKHITEAEADTAVQRVKNCRTMEDLCAVFDEIRTIGADVPLDADAIEKLTDEERASALAAVRVFSAVNEKMDALLTEMQRGMS